MREMVLYFSSQMVTSIFAYHTMSETMSKLRQNAYLLMYGDLDLCLSSRRNGDALLGGDLGRSLRGENLLGGERSRSGLLARDGVLVLGDLFLMGDRLSLALQLGLSRGGVRSLPRYGGVLLLRRGDRM